MTLAFDPVKSDAQRRAMYAALEGHSTLGIPRSVAEKFVGPGAHDLDLERLGRELRDFFREEAREPEHSDDHEIVHAAGVVFLTPSGKALFLKYAGAGGQWCFPGGRIEQGEDARAAARREVQEEAGYLPEEKFERVDERTTPSGVHFTTFCCYVEGEFQVCLSPEHDAWAWAPLTDAPEPLLPAVREWICWYCDSHRAHDEAIAQDWAESARTYDTDGRMHVSRTPISKANVCPYWGREIPRFKELGLDPEKKYHLWRHPEELQKGAHTFNNIPLLMTHVGVSAHAPGGHRKDVTVGSTGTDSEFEHPYLYNSLAVWTKEDIDQVNSGRKRELSSSYHYDPDMTSGKTPEGEHYDGIMRNIRANHVALVVEGRAGPDVLVHDAALDAEREGGHVWNFSTHSLVSKLSKALPGMGWSPKKITPPSGTGYAPSPKPGTGLSAAHPTITTKPQARTPPSLPKMPSVPETRHAMAGTYTRSKFPEKPAPGGGKILRPTEPGKPRGTQPAPFNPTPRSATAGTGHIAISAHPRGGGPSTYTGRASSHAGVEAHMSEIQSHLASKSLGTHAVTVHNTHTGEVHGASVHPTHGVFNRTYGKTSFGTASHDEANDAWTEEARQASIAARQGHHSKQINLHEQRRALHEAAAKQRGESAHSRVAGSHGAAAAAHAGAGAAHQRAHTASVRKDYGGAAKAASGKSKRAQELTRQVLRANSSNLNQPEQDLKKKSMADTGESDRDKRDRKIDTDLSEGTATLERLKREKKDKEYYSMDSQILKPLLAYSATNAHVRPLLAADAKLPDFTPIFAGVTSDNYGEMIPAIIGGVMGATHGKLAKDKTLDGLGTVLGAILAMDMEECDPGEGEAKGKDGEMPENGTEGGMGGAAGDRRKSARDSIREHLKRGDSAAAADAFDKMCADEDMEEEEEEKKKKESEERKKADDARRASDAQAMDKKFEDFKKTQAEISEAIRDVRPHVGEINIAMDSAQAVYVQALKMRGVTAETSWPISALKALLAKEPKLGERRPGSFPSLPLAKDSAGGIKVHEMFPDLKNIGVGTIG